VSVFAAAVAALYRDANVSVAATWQAAASGSQPVSLRVIPLDGEALLRLSVAELPGLSAAFRVRCADLPAPHVGGVLTVNGTDWTVVAPPLADARGLVWTLEVQRR
jgi:capsid protein